jgi:arylformamidase
MAGMLFDISRTLTIRTAVFPGDTPVSIAEVMKMRAGDYCNVSSITLSVHAGTHIDAPRHYADGAPGVDELELDALIGPARVVTLDVDVISLDALRGASLSGVQRLLVHTRASDVPDDVWDANFAPFTPEAADWLGAQGLRLVGTDAPSVDEAISQELPAHKQFLRHGVTIVENLCLRGVPDGDYELLALPMKIAGGDAAPARVILREQPVASNQI